MGEAIGIAGVFIGCCLNAVFLELLVKGDPGCGNLVTFSQFFFIALEGFIFTRRFGTKRRYIPLRSYAVVVAMFFICNLCNNYAFDFNIAMPLHMIFRSGSLVANMVMGIIILKRTYPVSKFVSVAFITCGVIICTIMSGQDIKKESIGISLQSNEDSLFWWFLGISLLIFALFVSARLGIYQEVLFTTYGKHPYEALYFTHLLPLPFFLLISKNLLEHFYIILESPTFSIDLLGLQLSIPLMFIYLVGNVLTQYLCISSVYYLTTETSSFTVTLVLTLRKFASLLFSIFYFQNTFTLFHWIGTICVFVGTLTFTEIHLKLHKIYYDSKMKQS
ncbi:hypothetical protein AAG570_007962 [Ranatra chinensis]|uniref:UDP-xylose and UDP-N-acetylglucosamine transporter n=1 Tax=Ranatra chinensis TaxID=642074 RepID=A0ABD0XTC3_9HEMI